jgi:hypothetical protein
MLAAAQMATEDANQRATLEAYTKGKELELAAKRGEISPADYLKGLTINTDGTITLADGKVFDKNGNPIKGAKGGKLKRTK